LQPGHTWWLPVSVGLELSHPELIHHVTARAAAPHGHDQHDHTGQGERGGHLARVNVVDRRRRCTRVIVIVLCCAGVSARRHEELVKGAAAARPGGAGEYVFIPVTVQVLDTCERRAEEATLGRYRSAAVPRGCVGQIANLVVREHCSVGCNLHHDDGPRLLLDALIVRGADRDKERGGGLVSQADEGHGRAKAGVAREHRADIPLRQHDRALHRPRTCSHVEDHDGAALVVVVRHADDNLVLAVAIEVGHDRDRIPEPRSHAPQTKLRGGDVPARRHFTVIQSVKLNKHDPSIVVVDRRVACHEVVRGHVAQRARSHGEAKTPFVAEVERGGVQHGVVAHHTLVFHVQEHNAAATLRPRSSHG